MTKSTITQLPDTSGFSLDPLTDVLRSGARRLIEQAVEAELAGLLAAHADETTGDGRARLVRHGLDHLQRTGCPFVIVLGHPAYYPRFGFEPASRYKLNCQWEGVPDEAFMVVVFERAVLPEDGGIVRYRGEFDEAM